MNTHFMVEVTAVTKEVKGSTCKTSHLKTKTKLELHFTKEDRAKVDILNGVDADITMLDLGANDVPTVVMTVEGAQAIGRLINRSVIALGKVGINCSELDWEAEAGVVELSGSLPLTGNDVPILLEVMARLVMRSIAPISGTHHALTLFDLKQSIGVVHDAKGGDEDAVNIMDWFAIRELILLEETKAAKAEVKAKAKAVKDVERAEAKKVKATEKAALRAAKASEKAEGTEKNPPKAKKKAKSKAKAPAKEAADLTHLTE